MTSPISNPDLKRELEAEANEDVRPTKSPKTETELGTILAFDHSDVSGMPTTFYRLNWDKINQDERRAVMKLAYDTLKNGDSTIVLDEDNFDLRQTITYPDDREEWEKFYEELFVKVTFPIDVKNLLCMMQKRYDL